MAGANDYAQTAFTAGEISPRARGRFTEEFYRRALAYCLNWEVLPQGSLRMRGGTRYLGQLSGAGDSRLIPLQVASGDSYLLELKDHSLRAYSLAGGVVQPSGVSTSSLLTNGDFSTLDGASWSVVGGTNAQVFDPFPGEMSLRLGGARLAYQPIVLAAASDVTVRYTITRNATPDGSSWPSRLRVVLCTGVPNAAGPTGSILYDATEADDYPPTHVESVVSIPAVAAGTYYLVFRLEYEPAYMANGGKSIDNVSATALLSAALVDIPTPWTQVELKDVQWASEPGQDRVYFVHPNHAPWSIRYRGTGAWDFGDLAFVSAPVEWEGANWPGVVDVFQSRLWLASRNNVWASRPGNPVDFTTEDVVDGTRVATAANAIAEALATKGSIRWLRGRQAMLVGTDVGLGVISAQSGVISPLDFQFAEQGAYSAADEQAVDLGGRVVYLSRDRRKARVIEYAREQDAWNAHDLTFVAEHLTAASAARLAFAADPLSVLTLLCGDGSLACCTFDRDEKVAAWWRATVTGGRVVSVAVLQAPDGSRLYAAVRRPSGLCLEYLTFSEVGRVYLDAAVTLPVPAGDAPVIAGLGHLEGQQVRIVLDGSLEDDQVVAGGHVQLARAGTNVTIGLAYQARAVTLVPGAQHAQRRWARLWLRLNDSALPLVDGSRPPDRSPTTPLDSPEPRWTADVGPISGMAGNRAEVELVQDLPIRTEVLALFGTLKSSEV